MVERKGERIKEKTSLNPMLALTNDPFDYVVVVAVVQKGFM